jgi:hypothetical protein
LAATIGGNAHDGISLANCVESGKRVAACAENFLRVHGVQAAPRTAVLG